MCSFLSYSPESGANVPAQKVYRDQRLTFFPDHYNCGQQRDCRVITREKYGYTEVPYAS